MQSRETQGSPGSRAPQLWLEQRISSDDLFGRSFVLLAAPDGKLWCEAARKVAEKFEGLRLDAHRVGSMELRDPAGRFTIDYGISNSGAVVVRPDGFVAWRAKSLDRNPESALTELFRQLLDGEPSAARKTDSIVRDDTSRREESNAPSPAQPAMPAAPRLMPGDAGHPTGGFCNPYARAGSKYAAPKR
jgi:hypothetical protein